MHAQWPKHAEMEHINHHLQWDPPMFAGDSFLFFLPVNNIHLWLAVILPILLGGKATTQPTVVG